MEMKKKLVTEIVSGVNTEYKANNIFLMEEDLNIMIR